MAFNTWYILLYLKDLLKNNNIILENNIHLGNIRDNYLQNLPSAILSIQSGIGDPTTAMRNRDPMSYSSTKVESCYDRRIQVLIQFYANNPEGGNIKNIHWIVSEFYRKLGTSQFTAGTVLKPITDYTDLQRGVIIETINETYLYDIQRTGGIVDAANLIMNLLFREHVNIKP